MNVNTSAGQSGFRLWFGHFLLALCAVFLVACQHTPPQCQNPDTAALLRLIDQRLAVAPLVAQAKWNSGAPIDDPVREKQILDSVTRQAAEAGLNAAFAQRFFQAQFDAGKLIQRKLHEQWRTEKHAPFSPVPDLARDVRPVLDELTPQLIAALIKIYPQHDNAAFKTDLAAQSKLGIRGDVDGVARTMARQLLWD